MCEFYGWPNASRQWLHVSQTSRCCRQDLVVAAGGDGEHTALCSSFTATLAPLEGWDLSLNSREPSLFTLPSQCCWRILGFIVRVAGMTVVLREPFLSPGSKAANDRARRVLGGQVLVDACFSGGSKMRLLWVTCCCTQLEWAKWNGVRVFWRQEVVQCIREKVDKHWKLQALTMDVSSLFLLDRNHLLHQLHNHFVQQKKPR